jgi:hypothetical protein
MSGAEKIRGYMVRRLESGEVQAGIEEIPAGDVECRGAHRAGRGAQVCDARSEHRIAHHGCGNAGYDLKIHSGFDRETSDVE